MIVQSFNDFSNTFLGNFLQSRMAFLIGLREFYSWNYFFYLGFFNRVRKFRLNYASLLYLFLFRISNLPEWFRCWLQYRWFVGIVDYVFPKRRLNRASSPTTSNLRSFSVGPEEGDEVLSGFVGYSKPEWQLPPTWKRASENKSSHQMLTASLCTRYFLCPSR